MSNPWNTTPADLALTPFHQLLQNFETASSSSATTSSSQSSSSSFTMVSVRHPVFASGSIVNRLRAADKIIQAKRNTQIREKAMEIRPEIKQSLELEEELHRMFDEMAKSLQSIEKASKLPVSNGSTNTLEGSVDLLRQAYLRVFNTSQVIWDDISHENKGKLVNCIRLAIKAIFFQIQARGKDDPSFATHQKVVSDLMERTTIFDENKEFEDFYLEDLYDLLTECCNSLELIRRSLQPLKLNNKPSPSRSVSQDSISKDLSGLSPEKGNEPSKSLKSSPTAPIIETY